MSGGYAVAQTPVIAPEDRPTQHAIAVEHVRGEQFDEALAILAALHHEEPSNTLYLNDYAATLAWAEQDRQALEVASRIDFESAPNYVLYAIAKSARNVRGHETAIRLYTRARSIDAGGATEPRSCSWPGTTTVRGIWPGEADSISSVVQCTMRSCSIS